MKAILTVLLSIILLSHPTSVSAESGCKDVLYYSMTDWISQGKLFDVTFSNTRHFVNTKGLGVSFNLLGTRDYPNKSSSTNFDIGHKTIIKSTQNVQSRNFFQIQFSEKIYIENITLDIKAISSSNNLFSKKIYKNASVHEYSDENRLGIDYVSGTLVGTYSDDESTIVIDDTIQSLIIWYDHIEDITEFHFNGFEISNYQSLEHIGWTTSPIENAKTTKVTVCSETGNYLPDGTFTWQKQAETFFSPSITALDYTPSVLQHYYSNYDAGKKIHIQKNTNPSVIKEELPYGSSIDSFMKLTNNQWQSYGEYGTTFPYIYLNKTNTGILYNAKAAHWNWSDGFHESESKSWCEDVLGKYKEPCYKDYGHTSNTRGNVYEVVGYLYSNVTPPLFRAIQKVEYYLINTDTNNAVHLKTVNDGSTQQFKIDETGKWIIESHIFDLAGNVGKKVSKPFLIDNENPIISFTPVTYQGNESLEVNIQVSDSHSKIKVWRYAIDKGNGYEAYSDFISNDEQHPIFFQESGTYKIKVHAIDHAGNESIAESQTYEIHRPYASISTMYTTVYEKNKTNKLHIKLDMQDISTNNPVSVKTLINNEVLNHITTTDDSVIIDYKTADEQITIQVILNDDTNNSSTMKLEACAISNTHYSGQQIIFNEPVVFMVDDSGQKNYYEELAISLKTNKTSYFVGEGIDIEVNANYFNECSSVNNFKCISSAENYYPGNNKFIFDNAAKNIDQLYFKNGLYEVEATYDNGYKLPAFYAGKKLGEICLQPENCNEDEVINAGRRWYTDKTASFGEYQIINVANDVAINKVSWQASVSYTLDETLFDQFKIRFADPSNPFPNSNSAMWQEYESWITQFK